MAKEVKILGSFPNTMTMVEQLKAKQKITGLPSVEEIHSIADGDEIQLISYVHMESIDRDGKPYEVLQVTAQTADTSFRFNTSSKSFMDSMFDMVVNLSTELESGKSMYFTIGKQESQNYKGKCYYTCDLSDVR